MLTALARAVAQLTDPALFGVIARSVLLALLSFAGLFAGTAWLVSGWVGQGGWLGWLAGLLGGLGALLLALWFFVPVVLLIATLFVNRVAGAVERRFYPLLPPARAAPVAEQTWDALVLGGQLVLWQAASLLASFLLPGIGFVAGILITGWAIGRGLFVSVAMRRLSRAQSLDRYRARAGSVLATGVLLALASLVPPLNLLVPVLGIAAMAHLFCLTTRARTGL